MSTKHAFAPTKTWASRAGIGGVAALALVVGGLAMQANADGGALSVYDEGDSPNPLSVTEGLVFSKGSDLGWAVSTPIADLGSMSYTVASSISTSTPVSPVAYAPSFQLVALADRNSKTQAYTRLVWEPYMQDAELNPSQGEYSDLEDGVWWTSKIDNPNPGSQSDPQPLSFFQNGAGAGWNNVNVFAIAVHQGTTTDVTSVVTSVTYAGTAVALGNADTTPFTQDDIDGAVAPLNDQIVDLVDDLADTQDELADAEAALAAYKATHHTKDGSSVGTSRVVLAGQPVHGKTVGAKVWGTLSTKATGLTYQWYVSGKAVVGANKATFKVPATATNRSVSVKVTGTYKNIVFSVRSAEVAAS